MYGITKDYRLDILSYKKCGYLIWYLRFFYVQGQSLRAVFCHILLKLLKKHILGHFITEIGIRCPLEKDL